MNGTCCKHLFVLPLVCVHLPASAIVLYDSATRNTSAPAGTLSNSGWQYQGKVGEFLGTPISPRHFAIAAHTGAGIGNTFNYNSTNYTVNGFWDIPDTDIRIARVNGTLPTFAPVYNEAVDGDLPGKFVTLFGRGRQRGTEVHLASPPRPGESTLRGWTMGATDGVQSWGTNVIEGFGVDDTGDEKEYVFFNLSATGGTDEEGMVSDKDSGGAMFAQGANGVWKFVGVHSGLDYGAFKYSPGGASEFQATTFDRGGLYVRDIEATPEPPFQYILEPDEVEDIPQNGFSSNVSNFLDVLAPFIPIPGDADYNGKVNTLDFNTFTAHYGTATGALWAQGDFNWDGAVNSVDFNLLIANFGEMSPASPIAAAALDAPALAPEPAALGIIALAPFLSRRRR